MTVQDIDQEKLILNTFLVKTLCLPSAPNG